MWSILAKCQFWEFYFICLNVSRFPRSIDAVGPAVWYVPGQGDEGPTAVGSTQKCQKG